MAPSWAAARIALWQKCSICWNRKTKLYRFGKKYSSVYLRISYKSKRLRELCEKRSVAEKAMGTACARKLMLRVQAIEAAARVTELVGGNPHPLKGDRHGQFALDLAGGWRLVFAPANEPCPKKPDGGIDWAQVTIVNVEYIGDYHD